MHAEDRFDWGAGTYFYHAGLTSCVHTSFFPMEEAGDVGPKFFKRSESLTIWAFNPWLITVTLPGVRISIGLKNGNFLKAGNRERYIN